MMTYQKSLKVFSSIYIRRISLSQELLNFLLFILSQQQLSKYT